MNEKMIMYAMRYALLQHGTPVFTVCEEIGENWKDLDSYTKDLIQGEIKLRLRAVDFDEKKKNTRLMALDDRFAWETILTLE